MKRKYFSIILVLILAMFLSGCGSSGIVTPANNEAKIKSVINEYFLALNDQNWSKAKGYCIYNSDMYYAICQMEDLANTIYTYCNIVTVNAVVKIYDVSIYGNHSQAYCYFTYVITYCGWYESDSGYIYYDLQKIGNSWKLY
ncbi:MAG: hypothetical protein KJ770_00880 [Actinobacteria bacterium]|nr:hypothetical protein [Actinomycetota bacterium]